MNASPFPGKDPYLEEPTRWPGVYTRLIALIADTLAPQLAPAFTVAVETVYARGVYAETLDYGEPVPPPPLSPEDAGWLQEQIAAWRQQRAGGS